MPDIRPYLFLLLLHLNAAWAADTDLELATSTYLGGTGADEGNALLAQPDGSFVIGGQFFALPPAAAQHTLLNATASSSGALLRLSGDGRTLLSITRLGTVIDDLDHNRSSGRIAAVGDFGLAMLNSSGDSVLWSKTGNGIGTAGKAEYSRGRRVAVGADGTLAALFNGQVFLFDADGNSLGATLDIPATYVTAGLYNERVEDLAVDSANGAVVICGWAQTSANAQTPYVISIDYRTNYGTERWKNYQWWASALNNTTLKADSRCKRSERGRDDQLYIAGYFDGGNTVFTRNPKYLDANNNRAGYLGTTVNNIQIDRWNNGAGSNAGSFAYFARLRPGDGEIDAGQFQYSSTGVNQPNGFVISALTADAAGVTYLGGRTIKDLPNRTELKINGTPVGTRIDNESALLGIAADFASRTRIATWTAVSGAGRAEVTALSASGGVLAVLGKTEGTIVTVSPLDGTHSGDTDVFFAVTPLPPAALFQDGFE